jgi:hypothetical protein
MQGGLVELNPAHDFQRTLRRAGTVVCLQAHAQHPRLETYHGVRPNPLGRTPIQFMEAGLGKQHPEEQAA